MLIKLNRQRIFDLFVTLVNEFPENGQIRDKRFEFAVGRNIETLRPEVTAIVKARNSSVAKFNEFESIRESILIKYAKKDENGKPIFEIENFSKQFVFEKLEDEQIALQKVQKLIEEYKDAIAERQKEVDLYNELINEEIEIDICKVTFRAFPDVSRKVLNILKPMIKETDEEIMQILTE